MNFAIRSAARSYYPYPSLFAQPACRRPAGAVELRQLRTVTSSSRREDTDMDKVEDDQTQKVKDKDAMAHSFGEGYSTRSDEEGFGGIYGRNQASEIKHRDEIHEDHPMYDKTQGCEVKEKEKLGSPPDHGLTVGPAFASTRLSSGSSQPVMYRAQYAAAFQYKLGGVLVMPMNPLGSSYAP